MRHPASVVTYPLQSNTGLTTAEQQLLTAIILGILAVAAIVLAVRYRSDLYEWFSTIPRVTLGTFAAVIVLILSGVTILAIWGRVDDIIDIVTRQASTIIIIRSILSAVTLVAAYGVSALFNVTISKIADRQNAFDDHSKEIVIRFTQVTTFVTAFLLIFSIWNINIGNILLGAGFLGVIVGLAARQTLSSSLAGFTLMLAQPFKIGDWVEIDGIRGRVANITIVHTRIRSQTGETIIIPNDKVMDDDVTNLSAMNRLQLHVDVGVDYQTDLDYASEIAREAASEPDSTMDAPAPTVYEENFDASAVTLRVYFWIENPSETRRRRARGEVIRHVREAFDENDIGIPFPQRTLSYREDPRDADDETGFDDGVAEDN